MVTVVVNAIYIFFRAHTCSSGDQSVYNTWNSLDISIETKLDKCEMESKE
jgi:hypothetical protein